jgi:hypothetical protein
MYPHPSIPKDVKDEEHSNNEPEAQKGIILQYI